MMKYSKKDAENRLVEALTSFPKGAKKSELISILADKVDHRYILWGFTVTQLRNKAVEINEPKTGKKGDLIERIWNSDKYTSAVAPVVSTVPVVSLSRWDGDVFMDPSDYLQADYMELKGTKVVPTALLNDIEKLENAVVQLRNKKISNPQKMLQLKRIRMVEMAEELGGESVIRGILEVLRSYFMRNLPKYPTVITDPKELINNKTKLTYSGPGYIRMILEKTKNYYNNNGGSNKDDHENIVDGLWFMFVLSRTSVADKFAERYQKTWRDILNYNDSMSMKARIAALDKLRTKPPASYKTIVPALNVDLLDKHYEQCKDLESDKMPVDINPTKEEIDNARIVGTLENASEMLQLITKWRESPQYNVNMPKLKDLVSMSTSNSGGQQIQNAYRVYSFIKYTVKPTLKYRKRGVRKTRAYLKIITSILRN